MAAKNASCLFCKIIEGSIPSHKVIETELTYAFLDIGPLSKGHTLVIPKYHGAKLHEIPDNYLADLLPTANKIIKALGPENYNLLQNNGRIAHQEVDHVHFHIIPKPNAEEGLGIKWPATKPSQDELKELLEKIKANI